MILIITLAVLIAIAVAILAFVRFAPQLGAPVRGDRLRELEASSNFSNGHFFNLIETSMQSPDGSFVDAMREYFKGGQNRVPKTPPPIVAVTAEDFSTANGDEARVTWLGHSSLLIQIDGKTILTDPMFGKRASPFSFMGPKRFNDKLSPAPEDVPELDAILISHDHYDHLDYGTIRKLHEKTDRFFVPLGVGAHLERWGLEPEKIIELDWWEECDLGGVKLVATPSRHFSGRGFRDRNKTLWSSWVILGAQHKIYFGADSGFGPHFKVIGQKYGPFDLTMLENGAYSQYWPYVHMMPEETAQAHLDLQGKVLLPIHWAQFNLSLHPWTEPIERLLKKAQQEKSVVTTPRIGESFILDQKTPQTEWWREEAKL